MTVIDGFDDKGSGAPGSVPSDQPAAGQADKGQAFHVFGEGKLRQIER
jgi:hypothetical protein